MKTAPAENCSGEVAFIEHDLVRCGMAAEVLRSFGELRLRVTGTSMLPSVRPGDVLHVLRASPDEVRTGDIVLFEREGRLFAHRVVEAGGRIVTRGDRHKHADPPIEARELLGRVNAVLRGGRVVSFQPGFYGRAGAAILKTSDSGTRVLMRLSAMLLSAIPRVPAAKRRGNS